MKTYIYIYIYEHIYIYIYVFVCVLMYTYLYMCLHSYNKEKGAVKEAKGQGMKNKDMFLHAYISKYICTCI
jgi:hypothetical protein